MTLTPEKPWSGWPAPRFYAENLSECRIVSSEDENDLRLVGSEGQDIGGIDAEGLQSLGKIVGFPGMFVAEKLSAPTAVTVLEEVMQNASEGKQVVFITEPIFEGVPEEGEIVVGVINSARELFSYSETAEIAYQTMLAICPDSSIKTVKCSSHQDGLDLSFLSPVEQEITPAVGDILGMGIRVTQQYTGTTSVSLFTQRLACLNGMTRNAQSFSWSSRIERTREHQELWLKASILDAVDQFDNVVARARKMAEVKVAGDMHKALIERATAMGIGKRAHKALIDAFDAEPGDTEWHLLNAFTRLATHGGLSRSVADHMLNCSGEWVAGFDLCTARLPRRIAVNVGASIQEEL